MPAYHRMINEVINFESFYSFGGGIWIFAVQSTIFRTCFITPFDIFRLVPNVKLKNLHVDVIKCRHADGGKSYYYFHALLWRTRAQNACEFYKMVTDSHHPQWMKRNALPRNLYYARCGSLAWSLFHKLHVINEHCKRWILIQNELVRVSCTRWMASPGAQFATSWLILREN